jgi:hypothetical protein
MVRLQAHYRVAPMRRVVVPRLLTLETWADR